MNPSRQDNSKAPKRPAPPARNPVPSPPSPEPEDQWESADEIRHNSQTTQDREHTIRRGDYVTTQTKEFPT